MLETRRQLRDACAAAHCRVDRAFGRFELALVDDYLSFLSAHGQALPHVEAGLASAPIAWTPRTPLLAADLAELGRELPPATAELETDAARAWGMLYVLEGSRFGGAALAKRVGADMPRRYLSAAHSVESWRAFEGSLHHAAQQGDVKWMDRAVAGALHVFERFESAAALELGVRGEC